MPTTTFNTTDGEVRPIKAKTDWVLKGTVYDPDQTYKNVIGYAFRGALILTGTVSAKTVPVAIAEFTGRYAVDVGGMMTGGVLAAIPPVLLSLIFQRYIVSGLTAGAVKG